jgi:acetolactate synthase I/II/III large subunit
MRHGGQILVDQLAIHGCDTVFCVPGESYLAALDGLHAHNRIQTITCRQEGGATMMADAYGKLTGKPGICFVTRGPGAANAASGVHVAFQDSTPMILFVGQVASGAMEREAFQEVDFRRMFGEMAKWIGQIDDIKRIPEYVAHAWHTALAGRPGPVVLALPEDMLSGQAEVEDSRPAVPVVARPGQVDIDRVEKALNDAQRPLIIIGGGGWSAKAAEHIGAFAKANNVPVCTSFRCQDYIDNRNPAYVGHTGIAISAALTQQFADCDLLLCIGSRLGELTTKDYSLVGIPNPRPTLIHVHAGAEELGRVYRPDVAINASSEPFVEALASIQLTDGTRLEKWCGDARAAFDADLVPEATPGNVRLEDVMVWLRENLEDDAIICNGAGNYSGWVHRYYTFKDYRTQLAPTSGSMGYGVPAAVAAKAVAPDRTVVSIAGDGCFMMTCQEMATAVQHGLGVIFIVANNGMYGTIRMHQERKYPGRLSATSLTNPDFAAMARSFGAHGERIASSDDFPAAFARAQASGGAALIELPIDPDALSPRLRLSDLTGAAP